MTVMAWDGRTLAADRSSNFGNQKVPTTKVFRGVLPNGTRFIAAAAGNTVRCHEIQEWIAAGSPKDTIPDFQKSTADACDVIVVEEGNKFPLLYQNSHIPVRIETEKFGFGSGGDFAQGALMAGATARQAVEMACEWQGGCGFGVDALEFEPCKIAERRRLFGPGPGQPDEFVLNYGTKKQKAFVRQEMRDRARGQA